jgi:hypothetical protein
MYYDLAVRTEKYGLVKFKLDVNEIPENVKGNNAFEKFVFEYAEKEGEKQDKESISNFIVRGGRKMVSSRSLYNP